MSRQTRAVTSREYKIMLRSERFFGTRNDLFFAAARFRDSLAKALERASLLNDQGDSIVSGDFELGDDGKQAIVEFYDTKDRRLQNSDFVFRRREAMTGKKVDLTLKRRHPDRFYISGSVTGRKTKFEEDIKVAMNSRFVSLHSLSGKVNEVQPDVEFKTLDDIQDYFKPLKKQLGDDYEKSAELLRVCNFAAVQTVLEGVSFDVCDGIRAECALIFWHRLGGDEKVPVVSEFSFRYSAKGSAAKEEPFSLKTAGLCLRILREMASGEPPIGSWVDLESPTKTQYVYSLTRA